MNKADYPAANGLFLKACVTLMDKGFALLGVDQFPAPSDPAQIKETLLSESKENDTNIIELLEAEVSCLYPDDSAIEELQLAAKTKQKTNYSCPACQANIWGKPSLFTMYGDCNQHFVTT